MSQIRKRQSAATMPSQTMVAISGCVEVRQERSRRSSVHSTQRDEETISSASRQRDFRTMDRPKTCLQAGKNTLPWAVNVEESSWQMQFIPTFSTFARRTNPPRTTDDRRTSESCFSAFDLELIRKKVSIRKDTNTKTEPSTGTATSSTCHVGADFVARELPTQSTCDGLEHEGAAEIEAQHRDCPVPDSQVAKSSSANDKPVERLVAPARHCKDAFFRTLVDAHLRMTAKLDRLKNGNTSATSIHLVKAFAGLLENYVYNQLSPGSDVVTKRDLLQQHSFEFSAMAQTHRNPMDDTRTPQRLLFQNWAEATKASAAARVESGKANVTLGMSYSRSRACCGRHLERQIEKKVVGEHNKQTSSQSHAAQASPDSGETDCTPVVKRDTPLSEESTNEKDANTCPRGTAPTITRKNCRSSYRMLISGALPRAMHLRNFGRPEGSKTHNARTLKMPETPNIIRFLQCPHQSREEARARYGNSAGMNAVSTSFVTPNLVTLPQFSAMLSMHFQPTWLEASDTLIGEKHQLSKSQPQLPICFGSELGDEKRGYRLCEYLKAAFEMEYRTPWRPQGPRRTCRNVTSPYHARLKIRAMKPQSRAKPNVAVRSGTDAPIIGKTSQLSHDGLFWFSAPASISITSPRTA